MKLQDLWYDLPTERVAQAPAIPRDHSKLMLIERKTGKISHHHSYELDTILQDGDLLVVNDSKTRACRVITKKRTGGRLELLFLQQLDDPTRWEVLSNPGLKQYDRVDWDDGTTLEVPDPQDTTLRTRIVKMNLSAAYGSVEEWLEAVGQLPLPPYILPSAENIERARVDYQTVYASKIGSAATPTAGLHFTMELLARLRKKNIQTVSITLHVGLATFQPIKTDHIEDHPMHAEWFSVSPSAATQILEAKQQGRRVIAVGSTSARVLEFLARQPDGFQAGAGNNNLFLYPPQSLKLIDGLLTNFHLPHSSLLALVMVACEPGGEQSRFLESLAGKAYQEAIEHQYRFFSYGDAMLILDQRAR